MKSNRTLRLLLIALFTTLGLLSLPLLIFAIAPGETAWSNFKPGVGAWISQLPTTTSVTATNPNGLTEEAAYQFSTDSGSSWSGWKTTGLQVGEQVANSRQITVTDLMLADGTNFIQYRIKDGNGQTNNSPAVPINVDTFAPDSPIDLQPLPDGWTNIDDFGAMWTNPSDPNNISGAWHKIGAAPIAPDDGVFEAGENITNISGLSVSADGEHSLWVWLSDGLGNADHTTAVSVTLQLDTIPPDGLADAQVEPDRWTNINAFDLTWIPPVDVSSLSGVQSKVGKPPLNSDEGEFLADALFGYEDYTIPNDEEGVKQLWLWPVDGAGNISDPANAISVTLQLDLTPPAPPLSLPSISPSGWQTDTATTFTATWENPLDISGIVRACYKVGSEPEFDTDGICKEEEDIESISGITATVPGSHHLFLWLGDSAGNIDKNSRRVALNAILWDPIPPEIFVDPIGPIGNNDWYTGPIDVTIIASDIGSSLERVEYKLDDEEWIEGRQLRIEEDGEHLLSVRAYDKAGNRTELDPLPFNLDQEPPITDPAISRLPVLDDWYDGTVTVWFSPVDIVSGPDYVEWQLDDGVWQRDSSIKIEEEGEHVLRYFAVDLAGNQEELQELMINVDSLPPVTSYVILPGDHNEGWYTKPVTVTLVPADEGIGVAATYYQIDNGEWISGTVFSLLESGEYTVQFYSVDLIGHEENRYSIPGGIRIDTDAPRAPTPIDLAPRGWTRENDFELILAMPPDLSGISGAFYKVGDPPTDRDDGIWNPGSNNVIRNVQTPDEGIFKAYVWLQDGAGNADHTQHGVWQKELSLAYDATPPTTHSLLEGTPGNNDWFITPVRVTLVATDTHSGVNNTFVSIDGGEPLPTTQFMLSSPNKHTIRFNSTDIAGNDETPVFETVRIDPNPPGSPQAVGISPSDWSQTNSFSLVWTNPPDTSGIAAGYYKLGEPPLDAGDGTRIPSIGITEGITVPAEGAWDLHFWLEDHAGNADISTRVVRKNALQFDNTAPTTSASIIKGTLAPSGWYITPVTIQLTSSDSASGVERIRYRLNKGDWIEATGFNLTLSIEATGQHVLEYQAVDIAGNIESFNQSSFKLDLNAPIPSFHFIERYQRQSSFVLNWQAADEPQGSGLDGFDLQSKDGRNGAWLNWGESNIQDTSGRYFGNYGHRYFFRLRARDLAGNVSRWVELPWGVYIDILLNGDFAGNRFGAWKHDGELVQTVLDTVGPENESLYAARLGSPDYGPNVPGQDIPDDSTGFVPVGSGNLYQTVRIPGTDVLDHPTLTFWYRMLTYDTAFGGSQQRWFDTLDLNLIGPTGEQLALRDGLPYQDWQEGVLADLGWRQSIIPLPRTWAGETVVIKFENWNRVDGRLNTWSLITDVRLWEPYYLYLPQISGGSTSTMSETSEPIPLVDPGIRRHSGGLR